MTSTVSWELYRSFLAVLQEGTLSGAARSLGIAQPTVGRHMALLEKSLGVSLFTRSPTGLMATAAASALQGFAESMRSTAASLERAAASEGTGVRGVVRVTASDVIGVEVLPPILAALRNEFPELAVELVLTNRIQDLLQREADVAVRMVQPRQGSLVARRVGRIKLGLHAHQRYLSRCGTPGTLVDLASHSLIGFDQPTPFVRSAGKPLKGWTREFFALRTDNDLAQLALIRAGAGIGVCQVPIGRRDDSIVQVLPRQFSLGLDTWITMHEDLRHSPRCRVTFDALVEGLQRHVDA